MYDGRCKPTPFGGKVEPPENSTDPELVRHAMRHWTTGVTIVTSLYAGERHGMTVSSFTSVSLVPPLVLIALEIGTRTHELVQKSGVFGVTILNSDQNEISDRFSGRQTEYQDRFKGLDTFTLKSGVSFLAGGLASFDCSVVSAYDAGSHTVFIGHILEVNFSHARLPLVYFDRDYRRLCE